MSDWWLSQAGHITSLLLYLVVMWQHTIICRRIWYVREAMCIQPKECQFAKKQHVQLVDTFDIGVYQTSLRLLSCMWFWDSARACIASGARRCAGCNRIALLGCAQSNALLTAWPSTDPASLSHGCSVLSAQLPLQWVLTSPWSWRRSTACVHSCVLATDGVDDVGTNWLLMFGAWRYVHQNWSASYTCRHP